MRCGLIEPGAVSTELVWHDRDAVREVLEDLISHMTPLSSRDIPQAIEYAVSRPAHVSVNEIPIHPNHREC